MLTPNALDYITVRGFKSIASIEKLPLRPVNIVIGANGSGKSNFIGVFSFLNAIREGHLRDYVTVSGGAEKVLHFGSRTTNQIDLRLSFRKEINEYRLCLLPTSDDGLYPSHENISYWHDPVENHVRTQVLEPREQGREAGISDSKYYGVVEWVRTRLDLLRLYHLHDTSSSSPMRKTARVDNNRFLHPDGANLPAFLYFLKKKHPESYGLIVRTVQQVTPFFEDFRLEPLRLQPEDIKLEWRHKRSDQYFDASSFSDGTLRFITLAALFLQPVQFRPSLILVDEPELGLHPIALEMLASLIRQASVETQVIVSTQSSLLLDHFEPEDVLVAERVNDATTLTRLKSEDLSAWIQDYSLGQLWEKNQFGGRPVPA